ncbi:trace amine-associated receptor 13c-like [Astyanax mexicanus]|uniref:trace amine-associated receptor 13c-like n=1 Tax=Astyanax mexicanus TaxID=7994 RepID=UPI0020CAE5CF|nr:trace amine-associated receptor 13c-like [Astyanax mexicanus]
MDIIEYQQNITVQYCFPDINSSCKKEVRSGPGNALLFIFLSCISVCTVLLNLLVIISISHFKQLHTPTNLLILSLAAADLLVGTFVIPVNIVQLRDSCWYLGKMACYAIPVISYFSMAASLYSMVLIAVDRYIAVSDPLHYSARVSFYKTVLLIIPAWSFCFFYTVTFLYFNDHFLPSQISNRCYGECILVIKKSMIIVDLILFFLAPCSAILVLYSVIFFVARRQARAVTIVRKGNVSRKRGAKVANSSENKAAKTLGVVIFVYLACYIPFYISSLSVENVTTSSIVWTVFGWLVYMNSSLNPVIYAIFYPWFRTSVKFVLTCRIFEFSSSMLNLFSGHV